MNLLNSISFWPSMCPSKHKSHSKTQAHSKHRSLIVSHSQSHSLSLLVSFPLSHSQSHSLSLHHSVSFAPSLSLPLAPLRLTQPFSLRHWFWVAPLVVYHKNKDTLSIPCNRQHKIQYMLSKLYLYFSQKKKKKLYLYYESLSHYFEILFLALTYHMFQLHYVFMC